MKQIQGKHADVLYNENTGKIIDLYTGKIIDQRLREEVEISPV